MAWTDLSGAFGYGTKLTSAQLQNLRDNMAALAAGDAGAPKILNASVSSGSLTYDKLVYMAGDVRSVTGGGNQHYEVLGADGTWRRCSADVYIGP